MSAYTLLLNFFLSLLVTEVAEIILAAILGIRKKGGLLLVFLANLLTNPPLVFLYTVGGLYIGRGFADTSIYFMEVIVVMVEAWVYASNPKYLKPEEEFLGGRIKKKLPAAFLLSIVLNLFSYAVGFFVSSF